MLKSRSDEETTKRLVASLHSAVLVPGLLAGALALLVGLAATAPILLRPPASGVAPPAPPGETPSTLPLALRAVRAEQLLVWRELTAALARQPEEPPDWRGLSARPEVASGALDLFLVTGAGDWSAVLPLGRGMSDPEADPAIRDALLGLTVEDAGVPPGYLAIGGRLGLAATALLPAAPVRGPERHPGAPARIVGLFWLDRAVPSLTAAAGRAVVIDGARSGGVPLLSPAGRVVGGIAEILPQPPAPPRLPEERPPPVWALAVMAGTFALLLGLAYLGAAQRRKTAKIVHDIEASAFDRAMRDPLTGLHNRSGFIARLDLAVAACKTDSVFGVIYIDLDRFKEVNDSYGHETGDRLLVEVTGRLRALCGPGATIARLGGDEFAAIVPGDDPESIVELGRKLTVELGRPFHLHAVEVVIGASVGVAVAPEDGEDSAELVRRADISMYRSKTGGRGQAQRFDSSMEDEVRRKKYLEGELRHAIERSELDVFYQPYFAADGETLIGVEALMRWKHREEGFISPGVFIPLAEQTGLIVEISDWAMRKAMADVKAWPGLSLAINVSPVQFRRKDLVNSIAALVKSAELEPARVEIEITEGVLVEDADSAIALIAGFHEQGFKIALDDFGTGYASLSYLRRFKFDKLKVDQYFVKSLSVGSGGAAIIHSVVALGRSLGLTVQAEGVETLEHHIFLRASGCHYLQGFYFSKPMDKASMDLFFVKHSGAGLRYAQRA